MIKENNVQISSKEYERLIHAKISLDNILSKSFIVGRFSWGENYYFSMEETEFLKEIKKDKDSLEKRLEKYIDRFGYLEDCEFKKVLGSLYIKNQNKQY